MPGAGPYYDYFMAQAAQDEPPKPKGSWIKPIGTVLGAGIGFMVGGPPGALAGASIGGAAGDVGAGAAEGTLTPGRVGQDALQAGMAYAGTRVPGTPISPQGGGTQPWLPDPFAPGSGWLGMADGGQVPGGIPGGLPDELATLLAGLSQQGNALAGPAPKAPEMLKPGHPTWELLAQLIPQVINALPPPTQEIGRNKTIGAWAPAIATAATAPTNLLRQRREGVNAQAREQYEKDLAAHRERATQAGRDLRGWALRDRKGDTDAPISVDEAAKIGNPAWAGMRREDVRLMLQGKDKKSGEITPNTRVGLINTLNDNMRQDPDIKDFGTVRDNYRRVDRMAAMGVGVGDLAVIFSYMKVLDPTSVVRETEFKNAADAVGQLQKIVNVPAWVVSGNRLTAEGRRWFKDASWQLFDAKRKDYANALESYRAQALEYGIKPSLVLARYEKYLKDEFMDRKPPAPEVPNPGVYPQHGRRRQ